MANRRTGIAFHPSSILFLALLTVARFARASENRRSLDGLGGINATLHFHNREKTELQTISAWGAKLVRVPLRADVEDENCDGFLSSDGKINEPAFLELDRLVDAASRLGLKIVLDLHTYPGGKSGRLWDDFGYWDDVTNLWAYIAGRYKGKSAVVGYDLLNEPELVKRRGSLSDNQKVRRGAWEFPSSWEGTPRDYFGLATRIARKINQVDRDKLVIVEGVGTFGHPKNFAWMRPIPAQNVVYSFHMYVPESFTIAHLQKKPTIPYDSAKDRESVLEAMEPVRDFAERHHANIFVGELGALPPDADGKGARAWLRDVLDYIQGRGWAWCYWSYSIASQNPAAVNSPGAGYRRVEHTERLDTLREYWAK